MAQTEPEAPPLGSRWDYQGVMVEVVRPPRTVGGAHPPGHTWVRRIGIADHHPQRWATDVFTHSAKPAGSRVNLPARVQAAVNAETDNYVLDYQAVVLNGFQRLVGSCAGCREIVLDDSAGGAFVCEYCSWANGGDVCSWCGYSVTRHVDADDLVYLTGAKESYIKPAGRCPSYGRAVCAECWQPFGEDDVDLLADKMGLTHSHDCTGAQPEKEFAPNVPLVSRQLALRLYSLDTSSVASLKAGIIELARPWGQQP